MLLVYVALRKDTGPSIRLFYSRRVTSLSWKVLAGAALLAALSYPLIFVTLGPVFFREHQGDPFSDTSLLTLFVLSTTLSGFAWGALITPYRRLHHGFITASLTPVVAGLLTAALLYYLDPPPPSDWRLIRRFERNEAAFNELRDALRGEGGLEFISFMRVEPVHPEVVGVSLKQIEDYRAKMNRVGLTSVGKLSETPEGVIFSIDQDNVNFDKYYLYRKEPPTFGMSVEEITVDEVETFGAVYRPIGDDWYLYAREISD